MQTILHINVKDLDEAFIQDLKKQFGAADIEIHIGQTPQDWLTEERFWELIDLLDWSKEGDDDAVTEPVVRALSEMPIPNIHQFEEILAEKLWHLDTRRHADASMREDPDGHFSVDYFLYDRCCVVANGKAFYEEVLNDPNKMPSGISFEPLLYIADRAFSRKTGKKLVHIPSRSYETYSNEAGWNS